jgi:4'-phosphopantetheinyl transferase
MPSERDWFAPPSDVALAAPDVHVWRADLAQPDDTRRKLTHLLDSGERKRMSGFRQERDRRRFAVTHGVLRTLLEAYLQIPAADIRFSLGPHDKPYVVEMRSVGQIRFSLAHSGDTALFAFAKDREVGVDLEEIDTRLLEPFLAERFFAPGEQRWILGRPRIERPLATLQLWTLKEAFLKATGAGLSQTLDSFEVRVDGDTPRIPAQPGWSLTELILGPQYVAALCSEGPPPGISCFDWTASFSASSRHWEAA